MGFLSLAIPIGLTMGVATWALVRGRGGFTGLLLYALFSMLGGVLGGMAANAVFEKASHLTVGIGALVGALAVSVAQAVAFGPRPKRVAWVDQKGVAVTQPEDGSVPKSLV